MHLTKVTLNSYLFKLAGTARIRLHLAHAHSDMTHTSYNHARWLKDRRKMMQHLADTIDNW